VLPFKLTQAHHLVVYATKKLIDTLFKLCCLTAFKCRGDAGSNLAS
jgi:hypothetical protein